MKAVCQFCGKTVEIELAKGWVLHHWLGYKFTEEEVLKVGICRECATLGGDGNRVTC